MDVTGPSVQDDDPSSDSLTGSVVDDRLDLTPRAVQAPKKRQWWAFGVLALIIVGVGFIAVKALNDATLFFYNADEAVALQSKLGTDRFRLQGTVESDTIVDSGTSVEFVVQFNGVEVAVSHIGDPPELFDAGMPVVLEGRWNDAGDTFDSDRMLIKHDEIYEEKNDDRLREAEEGGKVPVSSAKADTAP